MTVLENARHLALFTLLVAALYLDLASGRIPNALVYAALALGLILQTASGGWMQGTLRDCLTDHRATGLANALLGASAAFLLFLPFVLKGGFGGGDLKLMTAVGALTGLHVALVALVLTSGVGAALALALLVWKGRFLEGLKGTLGLIRNLGRRPQAPSAASLTFRYVPAIAAGTTWAWSLEYVRG